MKLLGLKSQFDEAALEEITLKFEETKDENNEPKFKLKRMPSLKEGFVVACGFGADTPAEFLMQCDNIKDIEDWKTTQAKDRSQSKIKWYIVPESLK